MERHHPECKRRSGPGRRYAFEVASCTAGWISSLAVVARPARTGSELDSIIESRYGDWFRVARFSAIREASSGTRLELLPAGVEGPRENRTSSGFL
jgi:hypothetical protein